MMNTELITSERLIIVSQLPIIEERLKEKSEEIRRITREACSLACTVETLAAVKKTRAELNRQFSEYENARKLAKAQVLKPYNDFEETYKDCITLPFQTADKQLKSLIDDTEQGLKVAKEHALRAYYNEHCTAAGLSLEDWSYDRAGIKILLSKSDKQLKADAKAYIDQRVRDLEAIAKLDYADEITVEYKKTLCLASSVKTVDERIKAQEEARLQRQAREREVAERREKAEVLARYDIPEETTEEEPIIEDIPAPIIEVVPEDDPVLKLSFTVIAPKSKLRELKQFLIEGGYQYE